MKATEQTQNERVRNIPQELKDLHQWVCHKANKTPCDPKTGTAASSTDSRTWGSFNDASNVCLNGRGFTGVGFVFTVNDPYVGIDLDHCVNAGVIEEWAQRVINTLGSYTEISPSGTGVHIFVKATLPKGARNRKGNVEIYSQGRYFCTTGDHVPETPLTINSRQEELLKLLELV